MTTSQVKKKKLFNKAITPLLQGHSRPTCIRQQALHGSFDVGKTEKSFGGESCENDFKHALGWMAVLGVCVPRYGKPQNGVYNTVDRPSDI